MLTGEDLSSQLVPTHATILSLASKWKLSRKLAKSSMEEEYYLFRVRYHALIMIDLKLEHKSMF
jgi:hypothetical protein